MTLDVTRDPLVTMCHRCGRVTCWTIARGGRALRCSGCGDRYPCRSCQHLDCAQARAELVVEPGRAA